MLFITILITIKIWRSSWNIHILPLTERSEFSQSDIMLAVGMFIEFLQYITTGPDFSDYARALYIIGTTVCVNLEEVLDLRNGFFFLVVEICIALNGLMI